MAALVGIPQAPAGSDGLNGVYWKGSDGNIYAKGNGNGGVYNAGKAINTFGKGFDSSLGSTQGFRQIDDPNPGNPTATSNTSQSAGGPAPTSTAASGGTTYADKSNDITLQNAGLGQVDATSKTGIDNINKALATIQGEYDTDAANANKTYTDEGNANQTDLQGNKESSFQQAVQGRQGLFSTLSSLGALSGTGIDLANNAVRTGANEDLTKAADTYATNQNSLDSGYNAFKAQDAARRTQLKAAGENDIEQVNNDAAKSRQQYLTNLANDYQAEGNTTQAKNFAAQAAALFPQIASTNVPTINLGYSGSAYTAPTLSSYVGTANNTTVQSTPGSNVGPLQIPGLVAVNKKQAA